MTVANAPEVLAVSKDTTSWPFCKAIFTSTKSSPYRNTQYITGGAVCGNWWQGPRLGFPEGFTVVSLRAMAITTRYETYGFKAIASPVNS